MNSLDIIIRDGFIVTESGVMRGDLGIEQGKIAAIAPLIHGAARETISAEGLHVFPAVIDSHVHFNEPGRTDWEGIDTGSRAIAAGGGAMFIDMPLNAHPPTVDAESFRVKKTLADQKSIVDFALWGGLVPQNLDRLEELADCGVVGFKAFMSDTGIDDFSCVDDADLHEGMKRAALLKLPVAVHAESEIITARLARDAQAAHRVNARAYLDSRPILAELDAIQRAVDLAGETGCALHVVHVSSAAGVALVAGARKAGVDVTCETCPHYLVLTEADVEKIGAAAKCAPPLRSCAERDLLWAEVLNGNVFTMGSDHSPSPPGMKQSDNFFKIWGGISGAQHLLPLLVTHGCLDREMDFSQLARLTATNVAQRFKLAGKGSISAGNDADLAFVNLTERFQVRAEDLQYRHRQSPYVGATLRGVVKRTMVRGRTVLQDGKICGEGRGKFVPSFRG